MNILVFDCEASGAQRNKANPFDPRNKLCSLCYLQEGYTFKCADIEHGQEPYKYQLDRFQGYINDSDILVGFNVKYDLHWIVRYGIGLPRQIRVWDCQLFFFLQTNQTKRLPSLDNVADHYGLPRKLDVVRTEYWDKGLDTTDVPWDILEEYNTYDVELTWQIFQRQLEEFKLLPKNRRNLILLHMRDLLSLQEMEFNGFKYNVEKSLEMGRNIDNRISEIDKELAVYCPNVPLSFNSDQQLSAFLYGGQIKRVEQEEYTFNYKDGRTAVKRRSVDKYYQLPTIFKPDQRWAKKKDGIYSVEVGTLQTLKFRAKGFQLRILNLLLERSRLEKRKSTYCYGTPELAARMGWEGNLLHPSLNQSVVVTGRLSCNKPNLQNQEELMQVCFVTRFPLGQSAS